MNRYFIVRSLIIYLIFVCIIAIVALIAIQVFAAEGKFSWLPNQDGGLTEGYAIHQGLASGDYDTRVDVGFPPIVDGRVHASIPDAPEGVPGFFAATAYRHDTSNNHLVESDFSEELIHTFPRTKPATPYDVRIEEVINE